VKNNPTFGQFISLLDEFSILIPLAF